MLMFLGISTLSPCTKHSLMAAQAMRGYSKDATLNVYPSLTHAPELTSN